jgi:type IV pilus assembly protein PilV
MVSDLAVRLKTMTASIETRQERGFTLVEVMIAMVVLSFGLLAVAAMQDMALGRNVDANEMSIVTNLAADMVERIRYNRPNVTAYAGIDTTNAGTRPPASEPMARGDYDQWSVRLATTRLQAVRGAVAVAAFGPPNLNQNQVTVQVTWGGRRVGTELARNRTVSLGTLIAPE